MYSILFTLSTLHLFTLVLFCKRIQLYIRPFWPSHVNLVQWCRTSTLSHSNHHLHLSFLARLERAIGLYSINNILCIGYYSPCSVGLLHSSVSHLSLQLQQILQSGNWRDSENAL